MTRLLLTTFLTSFSCLFFLFSTPQAEAQDSPAKNRLKHMYERHCNEWSDIYEHVPVLRDLAKQCGSVVEIGVRTMVSSWGILQGLAENTENERSYLGIDLSYPPEEIFDQAIALSEGNGIDFRFLKANDMDIDIDPTDMLFIDSLHTYCHLTYELEKFSPKVRKFIAMHDTSAPWGDQDDDAYRGNYSEYPAAINRNKKGLWPAVEDFLACHPEWELLARRFNNHGFTILQRVAE